MVEEEENTKTFLVKINPEILKKIKILSSHYDINQNILVEKLINQEWDKVKEEIIK
jgi:hypothetical protein